MNKLRNHEKHIQLCVYLVPSLGRWVLLLCRRCRSEHDRSKGGPRDGPDGSDRSGRVGPEAQGEGREGGYLSRTTSKPPASPEGWWDLRFSRAGCKSIALHAQISHCAGRMIENGLSVCHSVVRAPIADATNVWKEPCGGNDCHLEAQSWKW